MQVVAFHLGNVVVKDFVWNLYASNSGNNVTGYNQDGGFQNPRAEELASIIAGTEDPAKVQDDLAELQVNRDKEAKRLRGLGI